MALAKDDAKAQRLQTVLYNLLEAQRIIATLVSPFIPASAAEMWKQLGLGDFAEANLPAAQEWGRYPADTKVCKGHALFPRYDLKEEVAEAEEERKPLRPARLPRNRRSRKSLSTISARSTSASAKS